MKYTNYSVESALYGIFTLAGEVSEISLVRCVHSFDLAPQLTITRLNVAGTAEGEGLVGL